jgi:hypothetical protein
MLYNDFTDDDMISPIFWSLVGRHWSLVALALTISFTLLMQIKDFKLIKGQICINLLNN